MVIFRFLGQNGLKLELRTFAVHKILMQHWPSAAQDTYFYYYSTSGVILKESRPLFLGFHWYEYVFCFF